MANTEVTMTVELSLETREVLNAFSDAVTTLMRVLVLAGKTISESQINETIDIAKEIEKVGS